jgi:eukaryotic-like serine/threonine-protein kinase
LAFTPGTRLGVYDITAPIGEGGMGQVFRARDTKLDRDVAIKILPEAFAHEVDRLARFQREAKTLASLNHPNIAAIYGVEESGGITALVMELVEGKDLSQLIAHGAIPIDEAVPIAKQIAEALEAAHEQGIIHRDLKPANIKIRPDGRAKVLDFGLAKALSAETASASVENTPTLTAHATKMGMIIGTAAYMSPEQARGKPLDKRSDIWAFGCVLYEALTGRRAFAGETVTDIITAVVKNEPDWSALPSDTPAHIRALLVRCLQKDPRRRLRDIGDARLEIEEPTAHAPLVAPVRPSRASRLLWFVAGSFVASTFFMGIRQLGRGQEHPARGVELHRFTASVGLEESPVFSADGRSIAFVAPADGHRQIWVRLLAGGTSLQLTRDAIDHLQPRWTLDSAAIVYFTASAGGAGEGTLWEVPALGGPPRRIVTATSGGDLSHDGKRLAVFQLDAGRTVLSIITRDGSSATRTTTLPVGFIYLNPRWSPDDRWIAFQRSDPAEFNHYVAVIPLNGGEPRDIARGDALGGLAWTPDGSGVVYSSSQGSTVLYPPIMNLRMAPLNGGGDQQLTFGDDSFVQPDIDASGALTASRVKGVSDLWKIPVTGAPAENARTATRITRQTSAAQVPSLSPDENEIVYLSDNGGHGNLWVAATDGSEVRQLTFERDPNVSIGVPVWSPTSGTISFIMSRGGTGVQWLINHDGSGLRQFVNGLWPHWSPDGRWLYHVVARDNAYILEKTSPDGGEPIIVRTDDVVAPMVGRDGTLFFASPTRRTNGPWEWNLRMARPETAAAIDLVKVNGSRIPVRMSAFNPTLSPDEKWLAQPLIDGAATNLWLISAADGSMRRITDFGDRAVVIARRVSWSRDGRFIYAAVAEIDADVVVLRNLLPAAGASR